MEQKRSKKERTRDNLSLNRQLYFKLLVRTVNSDDYFFHSFSFLQRWSSIPRSFSSANSKQNKWDPHLIIRKPMPSDPCALPLLKMAVSRQESPTYTHPQENIGILASLRARATNISGKTHLRYYVSNVRQLGNHSEYIWIRVFLAWFMRPYHLAVIPSLLKWFWLLPPERVLQLIIPDLRCQASQKTRTHIVWTDVGTAQYVLRSMCVWTAYLFCQVYGEEKGWIEWAPQIVIASLTSVGPSARFK